MRLLRPCGAAASVITLAVFAACGSSTGLPAAVFDNVVDTMSLYALDGTPLTAPSAYDIKANPPVALRADAITDYDFVFNIDTAGHALLLPTGAIGLGKASGIRLEATSFNAITTAATSGYQDSTAVQIDSGSVLVLRSRPTQCSFGAVVYMYAKLEVLKVDRVARRMDFQVLADGNCGYRSLQPGVPKQ